MGSSPSSPVAIETYDPITKTTIYDGSIYTSWASTPMII